MPTKHLTKESFLTNIFDYEKSQDWKFSGQLPAIIDFYADWCGPCKSVAPVLDELADEYEGQIDIYKIDTEAEAELSEVFGIQSIPTFLFIPIEGAPMMQKGALPKTVFKQVIEERLLSNPKVIEADQ
jgi:thioredoxin